MKKSLKADLKRIASRILENRDWEDIHKLKEETGMLYDKLTVLSFVEKNFSEPQPEVKKTQVEEVLETEKGGKDQEKTLSAVEENHQHDKDEYKKNPRPDGIAHNTDAITEPNTEKIKDIVDRMPKQHEPVKEVVEETEPTASTEQDEVRNLGVHYDDLPQFEPVSQEKPGTNSVQEKNPGPKEEDHLPEERKKSENSKQEQPTNLFTQAENKGPATRNTANPHKASLNDRLKKGISIGLNDRMAYITHLFSGNASDYNRVLSQLNTIDTFPEAQQFIATMVKPDYNWENKEEYEKRFLEAIENKFD